MELFKSRIQIQDSSVTLEELLITNGLFFFKNRIQPVCNKLEALLGIISELLPSFCPKQASILRKFLAPLPDFNHKLLRQGDLSIFYSYLLEFIFNRPVNFHNLKSVFDRFDSQGQKVLVSFITELWGVDCLVGNELSIDNVKMLMYNQYELEFVKILYQVDFDIGQLNGDIHPEIEIIYGRKNFKEDLTFLEYLQKYGLFYTLATWIDEILCQKFLKHVFDKKILLFFNSLPLLQGVSDLDLVAGIFYRYFIKENPPIDPDIQMITSLKSDDYELIRIWQVELIGFSINFSILKGQSLGWIHDSLLELQMDCKKKAVKVMAELVFDSLIFKKDFALTLKEKISEEAPYFNEFLVERKYDSIWAIKERNPIDRRMLLRMVDFELGHDKNALSHYLYNRARFFDTKRKLVGNEIPFENQIDNVLRVIGKEINYKPILESPGLDIFIENALGNFEITDHQISFLMTLNKPDLQGLCNGLPEKSLNYIIEEIDPEKIRFYLSELICNPKILVHHVLARHFPSQNCK